MLPLLLVSIDTHLHLHLEKKCNINNRSFHTIEKHTWIHMARTIAYFTTTARVTGWTNASV
jgi:hypothetical protein